MAKSLIDEAWFSKSNLTMGSDPLLSDISGRIPSGITLLDVNMGGGFPLGRTVEIFGPESSGKSSLAFQAVHHCQQAGGTAVVLDSENTFHREFASGFGVDVDRLVFLDSGLALEDVFARVNGISEALRKRLPDKPILFVWDTLNASYTKRELEKAQDGEYATTTGGHRAQVIRGLLRVTSSVISKSSVCFLIVNHVYESMGGMSYGPTKQSPGGMGPKYFASIRIYVRSGGLIKGSDDTPIGHKVVFEVVKNKLQVPRRGCTSRFYYGIGNGFDDRWAIFDYAVGAGLIKRASSWYAIDGFGDKPVKFQSPQWLDKLEECPGLFDHMKQCVVDHYEQSFRI